MTSRLNAKRDRSNECSGTTAATTHRPAWSSHAASWGTANGIRAIRISLLAAMVGLKYGSTRGNPRKTVGRIRPTVLFRPKCSSIGLRIVWLKR